MRYCVCCTSDGLHKMNKNINNSHCHRVINWLVLGMLKAMARRNELLRKE